MQAAFVFALYVFLAEAVKRSYQRFVLTNAVNSKDVKDDA